MLNIGIVGLGHVAEIHLNALLNLKGYYCVKALCDINEDRLDYFKHLYQDLADIQYYSDYLDLLNDKHIDTVVVASPPITHFAVAKACIEHHKNIIVEKPFVLYFEHLDYLYSLANTNNVLLYVAYHSVYTRDLDWFFPRSKEYDFGPIKSIECFFYDDYVEDNKIIPTRELLLGSYIDSGVNALSVCDKFVDLNHFSFVHKNESTLNGVVVKNDTTFKSDQCSIVLHTAWNNHINNKSSFISYENGTRMFFDHTRQQITLLKGSDKVVLFSNSLHQRMLFQYNQIFTDYYENKINNRETTIKIHRLFLDANVTIP